MNVVKLRLGMQNEPRVLPVNLEAEQALIGAILVNNQAFERVASFLRPEHFSESLHGKIYSVAASLISQNKKATPINLRTFIADQDLGGVTAGQYLARLAAEATTVINAEDYARTVYDLAMRREFILQADEWIQKACDSPVEASPRIQIAAAMHSLESLQERASFDEQPLIISSGDFTSDFVPPDYLLQGILQRRFLYSLTAPTGTGKTNFLLLLTATTALGRVFAGRELEQGKVLYLAGENPDDVKMRWIALASEMGFDHRTIPVHFVPGRFRLAEMKARIQREVKRHGGFILIIIDTSAAYFGGDDDNSNVEILDHARDMREFTQFEGGPTVVAACHPVKNASSDNLVPRGGGAFVNEMDGNLVLLKAGDVVNLHHQAKFRGPDFEPIAFENKPVTTDELRDSKGRHITTVVARLLSDVEQQRHGASERSDENQVLLIFAEHQEISVAGIANLLGWITKAGAPHKSKVARALERLKKDKLVTVERGRNILTPKGKAEAERVRRNYELAGATYGH
ncbi:MAG TPA: DnaB-like helicase N-terminal domain-containing protein [Microvirga sp.]|jgi:DNA-binding MarR family transcriptional regulator|nr:DnaB-like helicase N-terminal domain-containing protein [Microvirga sp.]